MGASAAEIGSAVARLDAWLQTMRSAGGYGGPVAHWWDSCLLYTGPMADWRYEGIICGYLELYRASRSPVWLKRAIQAGDDLLAAQLPSGKYRNSSFEHGPMEGGTPHEAAADIGLFELALALRAEGDTQWERYASAARKNIQEYHIRQLWDGQGFRDQPWNKIRVANKNATTLEALLLYETVFGEDMSEYINPTAQVVLSSQEIDGPRSGGTVHYGTGRHSLAIGIYTARSASGILALYHRQPRDELLEWLCRGLRFLTALLNPPLLLFARRPNGSPLPRPSLIAPAGILLTLFLRSAPLALLPRSPAPALLRSLLSAQLPSGGIPTALASSSRPTFLHLLPVVGWNDKAFRALALLASPPPLPLPAPLPPLELECSWKGRPFLFREDHREMTLADRRTSRLLYRWTKGSPFPHLYRL